MRQVNCPKCGKQLGVPDASTDLKVRCRACNHIFMVRYQGSAESVKRGGGIGWPASVGLGIFALVAAGLLTYLVMTLTRQPGAGDPSHEPDVARTTPAVEVTTNDAVTPRAERALEHLESVLREVEGQLVQRREIEAPLQQTDSSAGQTASGDGPPSTSSEPPIGHTRGSPLVPGELPDLVERLRPAVATIVTFDMFGAGVATGTAFFIEPDRAVSNHHVLTGAYKAHLKLSDGTEVPVEYVVAQDEDADLIVLQVRTDGSPRTVLSIAREAPRPGEQVVVIGTPLGLYENTVSTGIVSAIREEPVPGTIQITAPISPGSSGSPVVNKNGELIGVATLISRGLSTLEIIRGRGAEGLAFAMPVARLQSMRPARKRLTLAEHLVLPTSWEGDPADREFWFGLAVMLGEDFPEAKRQFEESIRAGHPDYLYWWTCSLERRRVETALSRFQKAIDLNPKHAWAHIKISSCYLKLEEPQKAQQACHVALTLSNDHALQFAAYANLATSLHALKQHDNALVARRKAYNLKPTEPTIKSDLSSTLSFLGINQMNDAIRAAASGSRRSGRRLREEARAKLLEAAELDPSNDWAIYGLGWISWYYDDVDMAKRYYQILKSSNPELAAQLNELISQ